MAIAQLAPIANDFKIAGVPVSLIGLTLPALTFALTIDRVLNGICRPFFGWVSDHIGREHTMFIAFLLEGIGIFALLYFGTNPVLFVILSGLVFFAWGEIYSLFPATCTDLHGERHSRAPGAPGQRTHIGHRQLARGVLCGGRPQYHCRGDGFVRAQADAYQIPFERLSAARNSLSRPTGPVCGRHFF